MYLIASIGVVSFFPCNAMTLSESGIIAPSVHLLGENFNTEKESFKKSAQSVIEELKSVRGDDAFLLSSRLQRDLKVVGFLEFLVSKCKEESSKNIIPAQKSAVLEICNYFMGIMPYAGKIQNVIAEVLKKEFGVDSVSALRTRVQ
jgi:hypothetical protein